MTPVADRIVVITGSTGKLGGVVAHRFAEAGDRLALLARDAEDVRELAAELPGGADRHAAVSVDLADEDSPREAAEAVRAGLGPPSILLHLVGAYAGGTPAEATPDGEWHRLIDVNLVTTVHVVQAFLPDIKGADNGRLVTISTPLAGMPGVNSSAYVATKAAVESLTLTVAKELAGTTATANVILVRTIGDEKPTHTRPEEIAAAMLWLCSPEAGAVNGQRIPLVGRA